MHTRNNPVQPNLLDKNRNIREDPVKKLGLRLGAKKLRELTARNILASKDVETMPASMLAKEAFVMAEREHQPLKARLDLSKTPAATDMRQIDQQPRDFVRYTRSQVTEKSPTSKHTQV